MKKITSIICLIIFIIVIICLIIFGSKNGKFYLEDKYYNDKGMVEINNKQVTKLIKDKQSFILFSYNNFCSFSKPCDDVFEKASKDKEIEILQIPFDEFKKTSLYKKVKYAPSIIIINKGKIVDYLDAESDSDKDLYQDEDLFYKWLSKYVYMKNEKK